jgi:hypothetical protein
MVTRTARWRELPPSTRAGIVTVGAVDVGLRLMALTDLRRRSPEEINGPKAAWALALAVVSSAGVVPGAYYLVGRRRARSVT